MTHLSDNTVFRVIVGPASWYTTARQIRSGVGALAQCNCALTEALTALERTRNGPGAAEQATIGIAGHWHGVNVQLDIQS